MGLQYTQTTGTLSAALCYKRKDATYDLYEAHDWGTINLSDTNFNWVRKDVSPTSVGEYLWYLKLTNNDAIGIKYIYALKIHIGILSIFP